MTHKLAFVVQDIGATFIQSCGFESHVRRGCLSLSFTIVYSPTQHVIDTIEMFTGHRFMLQAWSESGQNKLQKII